MAWLSTTSGHPREQLLDGLFLADSLYLTR